jgi:succinyl-CoA synthetase beta subunit
MLLLEHDAKTLLAWFGIPVPPGHLVGRHDPTGIEVPGPWVVKAQVPVGGRGKAGGVRTASTPDELRRQLDAVLGMTIKGHVVTSCRVEQQVAGEEAYLSLSVDPAGAGVRLLLAGRGGVEIESLHAQGGVRSALAAPDWASERVEFCELAD